MRLISKKLKVYNAGNNNVMGTVIRRNQPWNYISQRTDGNNDTIRVLKCSKDSDSKWTFKIEPKEREYARPGVVKGDSGEISPGPVQKPKGGGYFGVFFKS